MVRLLTSHLTQQSEQPYLRYSGETDHVKLKNNDTTTTTNNKNIFHEDLK